MNSNELEWVNLIQMTIISTIVGRIPRINGVVNMVNKESKMQYLDAISKMTE